MNNERSKEWVLERIKKLLALGRNDGATEGERDNAMRMAHNLLAKYNLEMAEAEAAGEQAEARGSVTVQFYGRPWARVVAHAIAKLFFCEYVYSSATKATDTKHYFIGKESNARVASSMAAYVVKSIQTEAKRREGINGNLYVRSFAMGAAVTVAHRVNAMIKESSKQTAKTGMSLVLASVYDQERTKNALVVQQKFGELGKPRTGKRDVSTDAVASGRSFGATINLDRQIGGSTQKRLT